MSDPTPDDLYEALRKRLADYGQEPPAGLWADIRQQLPPPVAVPRRRRWRAGLVLLLLVFVAASLATWQWQRAGSSAGKSGTSAQRTSASKNYDIEHTAPGNVSVAGASAGRRLGEAASAGLNDAGSRLSNANSNAPTPGPAQATDLKSNAVASGTSVSKAARLGAAGYSTSSKSVALAVATEVEASRRAGRRGLGRAGAFDALGAGQRRGLRSTPETRIGRDGATAVAAGSETTPGIARASRPAVSVGSNPTTSSATVPAKDAPITAGIAAPAASREGDAAALFNRGEATTPAASNTVQGISPIKPEAAQTAQWDWLGARLIGLQLPAGAAPAAPQPVEVPTLPPLLPAVVSRWAVQLVGGPGITYRYLGTSPLSFTASSLASPSTSPIASNTNSYGAIRTTAVSSAASLEHPALGYGAQLSLRRTFTPHWTLSIGLGYAEYATQLDLRQISASQITRPNYNFAFLDSLSRASGTTIHQRDTYRFLTVPLRVGYGWPAAPRWQVGLLGGFDAAIYLGGTTTEGSACACQPQTWGPSGSPYRSLSLSASLGAEVRYRLAGPWQLLAQPTASYLLTPLAKPMSSYSIRHLFGATALLGVSYDLP